jgi:hypothetical protein
MTRPTRAQSLMRIRARKRICEALEGMLERDLLHPPGLDALWVRELVAANVERDIIVAVAKEIATSLRGMARSVRS